MRAPPWRLAKTLGHDFAEPGLLEQALTHRSSGGSHNERLEYLGDAILGFVIADLLYQRFPQADEGLLTRSRASLVRRETLADLANELSLSQYLLMGSGELRTGGQSRTSTLADAMEAVLGALYLDAGLDAVRRLIERLFDPRIQALDSHDLDKDPKTRLQELLQSQGRPLPRYETLNVTGPAHQQTFEVRCQLEDAEYQTLGEGSNKRQAEQAAATALLARLHAS